MGKKYVYLFETFNGHELEYKIGNTGNIDERIKGLQTGNPNKIKCALKFKSNYPTRLETYLHQTFNVNRLNGEWFNLTASEVNDFIRICSSFEKNLDYLKLLNNPFI